MSGCHAKNEISQTYLSVYDIFAPLGTLAILPVGNGLLAKSLSAIKTDFVNLPKYHIYLSLMIEGVPSKPFSAITINNF